MKSKGRILVVEDENVVAMDLSATLERLGYSVVGTASTGELAVEKAVKNKPDLILMDIGLKGEMTGLDAAEKISETIDTPVVFLTAYVDDQKLQKAKNVSAFGYIVKPFEENNLNSTIQMALHKYQTEKELELEKDRYVDMYQKATSDNEEAKIDLLDKKILTELDANSRASISDIAKKLSLSKGTVKYRINRLVENNYVSKFYSIVNASLLGYQYYEITMKFRELAQDTEKRVVSFVEKERGCLGMRVMGEANSIVFLSVYRNSNELNDFLRKFTENFGANLAEKNTSRVVRVRKFRQSLLPSEPTSREVMSSNKVFATDSDKTESVDDVDREIIRSLSNDSRTKMTDIAEKLKVDWKVVKYRMSRMEKKGILVAYTAAFNGHELQRQPVVINISVKSPSVIPEVAGFFGSTNSCTFIHELIGNHDMSVDMSVRSEDELNKILDNFKKKFSEQVMSYDVMRISSEHLFGFL